MGWRGMNQSVKRAVAWPHIVSSIPVAGPHLDVWSCNGALTEHLQRPLLSGAMRAGNEWPAEMSVGADSTEKI